MNIADVFVKPVISEQSMKLMGNNQYTFVVKKQATKADIRKALKVLFNADAASIHTMVLKGGKKRILGKKMTYTTTSDLKKAIITVPKGQTIDLFDFGGEDKKVEKKTKTKEKKEKGGVLKALTGGDK